MPSTLFCYAPHTHASAAHIESGSTHLPLTMRGISLNFLLRTASASGPSPFIHLGGTNGGQAGNQFLLLFACVCVLEK